MKKVPKLWSFFHGNDATPKGDRTESTDNGSIETASRSGAAGTAAIAYTEKTTTFDFYTVLPVNTAVTELSVFINKSTLE